VFALRPWFIVKKKPANLNKLPAFSGKQKALLLSVFGKQA
jgi:hypothetical protein